MAVNCTSSMRVGLSGLQFSDKQLLHKNTVTRKKHNVMVVKFLLKKTFTNNKVKKERKKKYSSHFWANSKSGHGEILVCLC